MTSKKKQQTNINSKGAPSPWALAKPRFTPPRSKLSRPFNNSTNNASMLEDLSFDSENEYLVTPKAKNVVDHISDTSSNASAVSFTSCSDSSKEVRTKTSIDHVVHQSGWLKRSTRKIKQRKPLQEKEDGLVDRIRHLERENREFERIIQDLRNSIDQNKEISNLNSQVETVLQYLKETRQQEDSKTVISLEKHEQKILELKEEQKKDLIDLQDRMLLWMNTQANVSKEREEMIQQVRQEVIQVKKECVEAVARAKESVNTNCCSLREFVKEETCDFQEKANSKIKQLEEALDEARGRIKEYGATEMKLKDVQPVVDETKFICSNNVKNGKTWKNLKGQFDAFDGTSVTTKGRVDQCDASVVSKITIHDTLTANNLFKELCYNKKVSRPKQEEVPSPSHETSDEDDDFMDALS
ncbi:predicted protein [Chaetoceros tenuissimus]|uniref:Uncharacterized protein n=1 Tax=Chaetoceros tenuissimus TaxID=426638 RepID=A0AAD3D3F8_9STRA|nr:predicted protein [Chaetoceros tenuissimus]